MKTNLRDELKLRYPNCQWIDVFSKRDLEFESEANFEDAIEVSAYKQEGIDFLKGKLLGTIP